MIKVAICDDEEIHLNNAKKMLGRIFSDSGISAAISMFNSPDKLMEAIRLDPNSFDVLLLDIMMGDKNGLDVAAKLREQGNDIDIVFTTSYADFALDSYKVFPVHYLVKPLAVDQLKIAMERVYQRQKRKISVLVPTNLGNTRISVKSLLYIEVMNRKLILHTDSDESMFSSLQLSKVADMLPEDMFCQCHKSFIVNLEHVRNITRSGITIPNGMVIPVGRKYYDETLHKFIEYVSIR